ncbi:DUF6090 family protein [Gaetbulibacter sp. M240]|uniref:DUF6090 family protein n=1 Tax=Gaetbulibacter sp. M240 TaxID=3126511 RepID=UPI00374F9FED
MIKFFRKIRYDLMEKNKTGKYLKYAIGEIILVVIGILIALSINNWNQKRIVKNQVSEYLLSIVSDLKSDITEYEHNIEVFEKGIENHRRLLINDDYKELEIDSIAELMLRFWNLNRTSSQTFEKIKNTGLQEILGNAEINQAVNYYYNVSLSHYDYLINWDKELSQRDAVFWLYNDQYESGFSNEFKITSSIPYKDDSNKRKEALIKLVESTLGRNYLRNAITRSEFGLNLVRGIKSKAENLVRLIEISKK